MKIDPQLTDQAVLEELGRRIAQTRLERNLTQAQVGTEAGVGSATVQRLEAGRSVKVASLIRVLRVLGLLEALDRLIPEPTPSPLERLKLQGKRRRRAAPNRPVTGTRDAAQPWTWGDERGDDTS